MQCPNTQSPAAMLRPPHPVATRAEVEAVLHGGENLLISTAGSVASIGYTFYYVEVPEQLLWKLA